MPCTFCHWLHSVTILTGFIATLTQIPELLLYAYPSTMMTMSLDLVTVDLALIDAGSGKRREEKRTIVFLKGYIENRAIEHYVQVG